MFASEPVTGLLRDWHDMVYAVIPPIRLERSSSPRLEGECSSDLLPCIHLRPTSYTIAERIFGNGRDFKVHPLKSWMDCGMILNTRIIPPLGISTFRNTISSSAPAFSVSMRDAPAGQTAGRLYERATYFDVRCAREPAFIPDVRFFSLPDVAFCGVGENGTVT
jgi:hypothetical protein